jgi:hypothetical protein
VQSHRYTRRLSTTEKASILQASYLRPNNPWCRGGVSVGIALVVKTMGAAVWVAIGVVLTLETGACKAGYDDDMGTAAAFACIGCSECTSRPDTTYFGAGVVWVGVAVVDKTKGFGDGRNGADKEGNTADSNKGWRKGGMEDEGAPVGIAVVVSVMGGNEFTEHDGAAAAAVVPETCPL